MKSGQIIKGKIDGVQKYFASADLPQITPERLDLLTNNSTVGKYIKFFVPERIMGCMVVKEAENTDGRPGGTIKHIVLHQYPRTTTCEGEQYIFDAEQFTAKLPRYFKMPPFPEELKNPLPPIAPLEWEEV